MATTNRFSLALTLAIVFVGGVAATLAEDKAGEAKVTFDDHVKPILREHCTTCHSESDKESDLALDSYAATLTGGSSGEILDAGNSSGSRLIALVTHAEGPFMPPDQDPIPAEQIKILTTWIDQGMPENSGSKIRRANNAASAMLTSASLGKPEGPPPMPRVVLKQPVTLTPRSAAVAAMAASPWAPLIAVGGQQQVVLYHAETAELLGVIPFPEGEPQSLTFTRDGKQLLIGGGRHSQFGCAVLVDIETGNRITQVGDELDTVLAADISPDKTRIAIAGPQKVVRVFDSLTGEIVQELKKHTDWIFCLRFSPDGVLLASGDRSNGLVVWEADTGLIYCELKGHTDAIRAVDFRPDSNVLASASLDGTLRTWDMPAAKQIKSWNSHGGGATAVSFAQDGQLASAGRDRRVKLWNGAGELQKEFKGLSEAVLEVAITGDGKQIAGGDWNGQVGVWGLETPDAPQALVPNPPSIDQRLAMAAEVLEQLEAPLAAATARRSASQEQLGQATAEVTALETEAGKLAKALTAADTSLEQLAQATSEAAAQVMELEKQLALAKQKQADSLAAETAQRAEQVSLRDSAQTAQTQLDEKRKQHTALAEADAKAAQELAAIQARVELADQQLKQAQADKALLQKHEAELLAQSQTTTQEAEGLASQLSEHQETLKLQQAEAEAAAAQLETLTQQLADLEAQLAAASQSRAAAAAKLAEKQGVAAELEGQLEQAEQAAAESAAKLKLFKAAYQKP